MMRSSANGSLPFAVGTAVSGAAMAQVMSPFTRSMREGGVSMRVSARTRSSNSRLPPYASRVTAGSSRTETAFIGRALPVTIRSRAASSMTTHPAQDRFRKN